MPAKDDMHEGEAREERERIITFTEKALKYGVPASVLMVAISMVAIILFPADPLVRSTRVLSVATVGLMLATLALVGVTYWQTNRRLVFETKRDQERIARAEAARRRREIDGALSDHFGSTWREDIRQIIEQDGTHQTRKVLRPFGVDLDEIER